MPLDNETSAGPPPNTPANCAAASSSSLVCVCVCMCVYVCVCVCSRVSALFVSIMSWCRDNAELIWGEAAN